MSKNKTMESVEIIVDVLTPFSSEDRIRVIKSSLALLGETGTKQMFEEKLIEPGNQSELPKKAQFWIKQNKLTQDQLEQMFYFSQDGVEIVISEIPGDSTRDKVKNIYILTGIANLLSEGNPKFEDDPARSFCKDSGCYDKNHSVSLRKAGNMLAGSKTKGWTVTGPGLKHGAMLVLELNK